MKVQVILASHGSLAEGMCSAVRMVIGSAADDVLAYGLDRWETPGALREEIENVMNLGDAQRYLIFADIKGGSVANELMELAARPGVCLVTGMNLPAVIALVLAAQGGAACTREEILKVLQDAREQMLLFDEADFKQLNEEGDGELW